MSSISSSQVNATTEINMTIEPIYKKVCDLQSKVTYGYAYDFKTVKGKRARAEIAQEIDAINSQLSKIASSAENYDLRRLCEINSKLIDLGYELKNIDNTIHEANRKLPKPTFWHKLLVFLHLAKPLQQEKPLPHFSIQAFASALLAKRKTALIQEAECQLLTMITNEKNPEKLTLKDKNITFKVCPEGCYIESDGMMKGESFETVTELMGKIRQKELISSFKPEWFVTSTQKAYDLIQQAQQITTQTKPFCLVKTSTPNTFELLIGHDVATKEPLTLFLVVNSNGTIEIDGEQFTSFEEVKKACAIDSKTASEFLQEAEEKQQKRVALFNEIKSSIDTYQGQNLMARSERVLDKMQKDVTYYLIHTDSLDPKAVKQLLVTQLVKKESGTIFTQSSVDTTQEVFTLTQDGKLQRSDGTIFSSFADMSSRVLTDCKDFTSLETEVAALKQQIESEHFPLSTQISAETFVRQAKQTLGKCTPLAIYEENGKFYISYYNQIDGLQLRSEVVLNGKTLTLIEGERKRFYDNFSELVTSLGAELPSELQQKIDARIALMENIEQLSSHFAQDAPKKLQEYLDIAGSKANGAFAFYSAPAEQLDKALYICYIQNETLCSKQIDTLSQESISAYKGLSGESLTQKLYERALITAQSRKTLADVVKSTHKIRDCMAMVKQFAGGAIYKNHEKAAIEQTLASISNTFGPLSENTFAIYESENCSGILIAQVLSNGSLETHTIDLVTEPGTLIFDGKKIQSLEDLKKAGLHKASLEFKDQFELLSKKLKEVANLDVYEEIYSKEDSTALARVAALHTAPTTWYVRRNQDASWAERLLGRKAVDTASSMASSLVAVGGWTLRKITGSPAPAAGAIRIPQDGYYITIMYRSGDRITLENIPFTLDPTKNFEIVIDNHHFATIEEAVTHFSRDPKAMPTKNFKKSSIAERLLEHHEQTIKGLSGIHLDTLSEHINELDKATGSAHFAFTCYSSQTKQLFVDGAHLTIQEKQYVLISKSGVVAIDIYQEPGCFWAKGKRYDSLETLVEAHCGNNATTLARDWPAYYDKKNAQQAETIASSRKKRTVTTLPSKQTVTATAAPVVTSVVTPAAKPLTAATASSSIQVIEFANPKAGKLPTIAFENFQVDKEYFENELYGMINYALGTDQVAALEKKVANWPAQVQVEFVQACTNIDFCKKITKLYSSQSLAECQSRLKAIAKSNKEIPISVKKQIGI